MSLIKVPHRFFEDHKERDLDTPKIVKATARHYIIDTTDPAFAEFESDALHYCESFDLREQPELFGVFMSARATVKAIDAARGSVR